MKIDKVTRQIGTNLGIETGIRMALSFLARVVLGVVGGLPLTVLSVSSSIGFILGAMLEIPSGVVADTIGSRRAILWGYRLQVVCAILIPMVILSYHYSETLMWALLILESVLDAISNSLISGAREAFYQEVVEFSSDESTEYKAAAARFLERAETFGKRFLLWFPAIVISSYWAFGDHWLRLIVPFGIIALGWVAIEVQLSSFTTKGDPVASVRGVFAVANLRNKYLESLAAIRSIGWNAAIPVITRFLHLSYACYYLVALLSELEETKKSLAVVVASFVFLVAVSRFVRAWVLANWSAKRDARFVVGYGSILGMMVGTSVLAFSFLPGGTARMLLALSMIFFIDCAIALVERPMMNKCLQELPSSVRATALSVLNCLAILGQGAVAVFLVFAGKGIPSLQSFGCQFFFGFSLVFIVNIQLAYSSRQAALSSVGTAREKS